MLFLFNAVFYIFFFFFRYLWTWYYFYTRVSATSRRKSAKSAEFSIFILFYLCTCTRLCNNQELDIIKSKQLWNMRIGYFLLLSNIFCLAIIFFIKSTSPMCLLYSSTPKGRPISMQVFVDLSYLQIAFLGSSPATDNAKLTMLLHFFDVVEIATHSTVAQYSVDDPRSFFFTSLSLGNLQLGMRFLIIGPKLRISPSPIIQLKRLMWKKYQRIFDNSYVVE